MTAWRFAAALLCAFLVGANVNVAAVMLPQLMVGFAVSPPLAMFAWQSTVIAALVALLLGGLVVRLLPQQKAFDALLVIYAALTLACALIGQFETFVVARALQVGAGMLILSYLIYFLIRDDRPETSAVVIGPLFAIFLIGYTSASISAGWIVDRYGWRWGLAVMLLAALPALAVPARAQRP